MWCVAKPDGTYRLWYTGINGHWSNDSLRAAMWIDRRDAWAAITANGYVGRAETVFLVQRKGADPDQYVPDEVIHNRRKGEC
jgi:hypothetical protein